MFDFRFRNCNLHLPNLARFCPTPSVHCNGAPTSPTTQGSLHHCWISFFLDFLWNKNPQGWEYMGMIHDMKFILKLGLLGARTITTNLPFCWIPCTAAPSSLPLHVRKPSSQKCLDAAPKEWQASCVCVCVCARAFFWLTTTLFLKVWFVCWDCHGSWLWISPSALCAATRRKASSNFLRVSHCVGGLSVKKKSGPANLLISKLGALKVATGFLWFRT